MHVTKPDIEKFFAAYAARFNMALAEPHLVDVAGTVDAFAEYFVESSPVGVHGGRNGLLFRLMVPRGMAYYKRLGTVEMAIAALDLTPIDDLHWMARAHWDSKYRKKDGSEHEIAFDVVYLLTTASGAPKIFAYIAGDEQKVLKEHGLI